MNLNCCFYDRTNKECKIYEVRPSICRSFKCNKTINQLEQEKKEAHKRAYWNKIVNDKLENITDMRLLFYDDPRSLISSIIYSITEGTMKLTEEKLIFIKKFLYESGQEELSKCIEGRN